MTKLEQDSQILQSLIDESKKIVFFGGAGVATESGIPDFRSKDGLYHQKPLFLPRSLKIIQRSSIGSIKKRGCS